MHYAVMCTLFCNTQRLTFPLCVRPVLCDLCGKDYRNTHYCVSITTPRYNASKVLGAALDDIAHETGAHKFDLTLRSTFPRRLRYECYRASVHDD